MSPPVVAVRAGRFGYRGQQAVAADLVVGEGEVVALLGPNGSGKTTLLKGMLGLVDRLGGDVEWFATPLERLRDRTRLGYVPQRQSAAGPIPVTVAELVNSGVPGRRSGRGADRAARVEAAISAVGLTAMSRQAVSSLSGGQQRRALVARALACGADVLLMDEPFAGVDQANQHAIADAMARLTDNGATAIVVLHELGPIEPLVTRAVCLDGGTVTFDGPLADAPPHLLHLGHDHDPHGDSSGAADDGGIGLFGR